MYLYKIVSNQLLAHEQLLVQPSGVRMLLLRPMPRRVVLGLATALAFKGIDG